MTRLIQFANNATSRLAANLSAVGTTITLIPGDGAKFPSLSAGQYFMATLIKADGTKEVVKVTARSTDTLTVVRAAEAVGGVQTAYSFSAADRIDLRLTAGELSTEFDRLDRHALTGVLNKSVDYTVVEADASNLIRVDSTAAARTITLPLISTLTEDFIIAVTKVSNDTNAVYVAGSGGNTINGATPYALVSQWQGAWLVADRSTNTWTAVSSGVGSSFVFVDKFTGTGSQTDFTLTAGVYSSNQVVVTISGVTQNPGIDYTASGTTLTFTTAPPNTTVILARYTQSAPQVMTGTCTIERQVATASQTGFALANGYIPGSNTMQVFVNGLLLAVGFDYTETGANSVVFTTGLTAGDEVQFVVFGDTVSAAESFNVGYTPSGTGAVATTVQAKLRESVSVKDFGAIGDGVTDDTTSIQAAITAGKQVHFPAGTYKLTAVVRLKRDRILFGDGRVNTIINQTGDVSAFEMDETTDAALVYGIVIKDMSITKGALTATTGISGIKLTGTANNVWGCKIQNVNVSQFHDGINIARPILTEVDNCDSNNNARHGFAITGSGTSTILKSTFARLNGGSGYSLTGLFSYFKFDTTAADQNTEFGYYIGGDTSNFPNAFSFIGCGAEQNTKDNYKFENAENFVLNGCYSLDSTEHGFHFAGARGVALVGCRGQNNGLWGINTSTGTGGKLPSTINSTSTTISGNTSGRISDLSVVADVMSPDNSIDDYPRTIDSATGFRVNGTTVFNSSRVLQNLGFGSETYHWYKLNLTYADFAAAALIGDYSLPSQIPAGSYVVDVVFQLTTEFSGGGVTAATLEIGDAGSPYNNYIPATNVFTGAGTGYKATGVTSRGTRLYDATNKSLRDFVSSVRTITARLRTTTANTNALTAGAVTVWVGFIKLP